MAIVTRAIRERQAEEAFERRNPWLAEARRERAEAWQAMQAEIKRRWPVLTDAAIEAIEEFRNRRAREIEETIRKKYAEMA